MAEGMGSDSPTWHGTDTVKIGTRDRALNDWKRLGHRASHECGLLDGTGDGSGTFTAITYKPTDTLLQTRRL